MAQINTMQPKIYVQVNVQLFRILHIDDSTENVTLDLGISFLWEDHHVASIHSAENYSTHPQISRHKRESTIVNPQLWPENYRPGIEAFDPAWKIENCSDMRVIKDICMVVDPSVGRVHQYIHLVAKVHHRLDMARFPLDTQKFCFQLRSEHTVGVMEFVKFKDEREARIFNPDATEWAVIPPLELSFETGCAAANGRSYAAMQFRVVVTRKPEWYLYNVMLVSWMIVTASFSILCIEKDNVSERLTILFTTWLLLISLKFVISNRLPKISYMTYLDYYLLGSYCVMIALVLYTCVQKYLAAYLRSLISDTSSEGMVDVSMVTSAERGGELRDNKDDHDSQQHFQGSRPGGIVELAMIYVIHISETLPDAYVMIACAIIWTYMHIYMLRQYVDLSSDVLWSGYSALREEFKKRTQWRVIRKLQKQQRKEMEMQPKHTGSDYSEELLYTPLSSRSPSYASSLDTDDDDEDVLMVSSCRT